MSELYEGLIIGTGFGYLISQLLLLFFRDEIFNWIDAIVIRVRKRAGLN